MHAHHTRHSQPAQTGAPTRGIVVPFPPERIVRRHRRRQPRPGEPLLYRLALVGG